MNWRLAKSLEQLRAQVNAQNLGIFDKLAPRIAVPDDPSACWVWTGGLRSNGYGTFAVKRDSKWTQTTAHRAMYQVAAGPIPEGFEVDHLCRNRGCLNPAHLEAVTLQENRRRRNEAKTHCVHGHLYTPQNTRMQMGRGGYECRVCRICENSRHRALKVAA